MPDAVPDDAFVARFRGDLERLTGPADGVRLGVALSGGPDSCALLLLAAAVAPGRTLALTVDHGLRPAAGAEARAAATLCTSVGVAHEVVRVVVEPSGAGLQAAARGARYGALTAWGARERLDAVLTAHHADDQAETLLMRLARGAGLAGLAGVRASRALAPHSPGGVPLLVRPLLSWRKAELEAIIAAAGIVPARDPSNDDPRYDRTAARRLLATTEWLDPPRIARAAAHLAEAEEAIEWMIDRLQPDVAGTQGDAATLVCPGPTLPLPPEIVRRLVLRLLRDRFAATPDGPSLSRAMAAVSAGETATVAGVLWRREGDRWLFRRAPPHRSF